MAKLLLPHTTTAQRLAATPLKREILYDTDLDKIFVGDGETVGGVESGIREEPGPAGSVSAASGLTLDLVSEPATPDPNKLIIWASALDGLIYKKDENGIVEAIGTGSGGGGREVLTADRTYYVRPDGNDSNYGLTNDSGGAFLTPVKARNACRKIDGNGYSVTIKFADSTYNISDSIEWSGFLGIPKLYLEGNPTTPANVSIEGVSGIAPSIGMFSFVGCNVEITGFKFRNNQTNGQCINVNNGSSVIFKNNNWAGAANTSIVLNSGGYCEQVSNFTISGGGSQYLAIHPFSTVMWTRSLICTVSNTPNFSLRFLYMGQSSINWIPSIFQFSGSATGKRFHVEGNAVLNQYGLPGNLPGNIAGTQTTGAVIT